MYKVYAIDIEETPLRIAGHWRHYDDAVAVAEQAFESLRCVYKVEVFEDTLFGPVARVSEEGIHDLNPGY